MTPGDDPVNTADLSDSSRQLVVENCVLCGETHRHGAQDPSVARGEKSHRVAHCSDRLGAGYYLQLAEDVDPPDWWREWVMQASKGEP